MQKYFVENLDQKFEYKSYRIFFAVRDSLPAEEVLNTLDRASSGLLTIFDLAETPKLDVFIYSDPASIEKVTGKPFQQGEGLRVVPSDNAMLLCSCRLPNMIDEEVSRQLSYLIFNEEMGDREIAPHQYRCPSWLREGACLQVASRLRRDTKPYLLGGWASLQEAEKADRLIKPNILEKSVYLIPDPQRRALPDRAASGKDRLGAGRRARHQDRHRQDAHGPRDTLPASRVAALSRRGSRGVADSPACRASGPRSRPARRVHSAGRGGVWRARTGRGPPPGGPSAPTAGR
ncbi:MAG TPA: hypothetical protein PKO06_08750, partial [Candidatus Ozemobacteraceae bacterium]|nr:hypothetical protein [Candidatus Ozemobacteraceae bacterium]